MSHAWTHSWCKSSALDEAVRASEDAAAADRPILPDHRELPAAVEHLRSIVNGHLNDFAELLGVVGRINERVGRLESVIPKSVSASSAVEPENKGDTMRPPTTKTATVENDFAEPVKCSPSLSETGETQSGLRTEGVTERRPLEPGGGGNVTGLRTERVVLEIQTHSPLPVSEWGWQEIVDDSNVKMVAFSVRVVDEAHFDDLAQVAMERDAAIRERDRLRHLLNTKEDECRSHHPWVHPTAAPAASGAAGPEANG